MKIFQIAAKSGSFSAAAQEMNYAQSNISTKIQQLEIELQTTLFYRHNRGITLTPKGLMLLEYTDKILRLVEETTTVMMEDGVAHGPLTLGSMETTASVYLPKLLAVYHQANPMVQLSLTTGTTADNLERVPSREFDAAFVAGPINHPDLKHQTLLVFPYGCCYRKVLEQLVQQEGITPEHIIEFNSLGAILASICAGLE